MQNNHSTMNNREYCEEYIQLKKLENHYWSIFQNSIPNIDVNSISEVKVLAKHQKTINNILSRIVDRLDNGMGHGLLAKSVDEVDSTQV